MAATTQIDVQFIQTGRIKIRPSMLSQPANRSIFLRRLRFLTDRSWTDWLPVYTFLISHPEGPILFDAGMSPRCTSPGYFPFWMPTFTLTSQIEIQPQEGIGAQLKEKGIEIKALKAVVLSHLRHDHSGGLEDLVGAPVYLMEEHWEAFKHPLHATMEGAVPSQWPKNFSPQFLQPTGPPIGPFEKSYPITSDGKVVAVQTPGHVPGHLSVIVYGDETTWFLTGDATYSQELLDREETDGVNDDPVQAVQSLRLIKELARQTPLVVLAAHDTDELRRKEEGEVYKPSRL
ncbi:hypothetical protein G7Y89_g13816 [Cudoniella acicularis]|uniref:Metallo-beta-lactamase domain-containing protein n=1 Tax=Cudoniella acicularis TaxID=354080 RepID=A0A8H4R8Y0_9HELO|nr:hypothetical protein G7Y89_g13816 [Cudoniella acicularis]